MFVHRHTNHCVAFGVRLARGIEIPSRYKRCPACIEWTDALEAERDELRRTVVDDERNKEIAERDAVVAFLRRLAKEYRKHANALLADTMQSKPEADRWELDAKTIEAAAQAIEDGRHWR
jgi:acyl-CoA reductase-like NAD-dependent aldehyde dehydrogenase